MASRSPSPRSSRLPLPLVYAITEFAIDPASRLRTIAQLSREGLKFARDIVHKSRQRVWTMTSRAVVSPQGLDPLFRRLSSQPHTPIQELRVRLSPWEDSNARPHVHDDETDADVLAVSCEVLRHLPELQTLLVFHQFTWNPFPGKTVAALLQAVALQCPQLRTLRLPASAPAARDEFETMEQYSEAVEAVLMALVRSLPAWKPYGGLTHVVVSAPFSFIRDRHLRATELLMALATNCPQLERLGSPNKPSSQNIADGIFQEEHWHVGVDTWTTFCASCTQLRAFDWTNAPFATTHFDVFGRVRKPQLTTLALVPGPRWAWHIYHRQYPRILDGYGETARSPELALHACPALRELIVGDDSRVSDSIFGDDFMETLSLHCPQLEKIVVLVKPVATMNVTTALTFTDRAMYALATLPQLTRVVLRTVNISGDGLFALAVEFAKNDWTRQRIYTLCVGDLVEMNHAMAFCEVVDQFLTRLTQCDHLSCADKRVALRVRNGNDGRWPHAHQVTLKKLVDAVLQKHRTIGLRVAVTQPLYSFQHHHPISFHSVTDLVFYTRRAAPQLGPCFAAFGDPNYVEVFVEPATLRRDWPAEKSR